MDATADDVWPIEIRVSRDRRAVTVSFHGGSRHELPAELLRVLSPSAEVQGHSREQRVVVAGMRDITVTAAEPVGNYGVRLVFADGHRTGIYTWRYLHELGTHREERWSGYLADLERTGQRRDG